MTTHSGMSASLGYSTEATYATPPASPPSLWLPFLSESLAMERERLESEAIIAGRRVLTSEQWNGGNHTVSGDTAYELYDDGFDVIFEMLMGGKAVDTTTPGTTVTTYTPGTLGKSVEINVQRPGVDGQSYLFKYGGCKVSSWEVALSQGEIATLGVDWVGSTEVATGAQVSPLVPTYPAGIRPLKFNHGMVSIVGVADPLKVKSITISGDNALDADRRFIGAQEIAEPLEAGLRTYEASIELEFGPEAWSVYQMVQVGTEAKLKLGLARAGKSTEIEGNVRFDGETSTVSGREILTANVAAKFVASGASDASALSIIHTVVTP